MLPGATRPPVALAPRGGWPTVIALRARVTVILKYGVVDPQGKAIEGALKALGIAGVASVRQGKVFDIELEGEDVGRAESALKDAAEKLLANPIIENYRIEVGG
jgi:phosphoribosylformylglycinamidine synthase PurS subunit